MKKITDRIFLGMISGLVGLIALMGTDIISSKMRISQRSYATTAAGVWVSSRRQAEKWQGQLLGTMMNIGLCMVGGVSAVKLLTTFGRDKLVPKGIFLGVTFGSVITAILSGFAQNKVRPKDANSNLSYLLSHALFGLASVFTAAKLGDNSLFDTPPQNDYLQSTELTTEQIIGSKNDNIQPVQSIFH
ncbi:hypothetical protein [Desulfosporosinus sp.]|uniref:hypothetical protein n=1 Tax=Desulfosporosinus sp. TaxID=157907 RepID=UPI0025BBC2F7|nr:hypothetical protein [Desulfosporosinus sp.]MBC2725093.1 hypothetical protein [Desulfosporosinus sp.]